MESGSGAMPRRWLASLYSALIPGAGHIYAGDRERGRILVLIDLALVAIAIVGVAFFRGEILKAWASLPTLSLIMTANLVLLSYRTWAAYDAYDLAAGSPPRSPTGIAFGLGVVVWAVVLVPHVALGYLDVVQHSLISEVFSPSEVGVETTTPTSGGSQGSTPVAGGEVSTTVAPPPLWDGLERLNVLLLGTDVGEGRTGVRTDTMIVVSIDPATGDTAMISLPRNFSGIDLPSGMGNWECHCFPQLLNDLYWVAEQNPDAFPGDGEPGPRAIKATIGNLLDLDIHYYAMVTLDGFVGIVDALGGVDIDVPNRIVDETYPHEDGVTVENVVIEEGRQHLDGHLALAYARIRRHADDFARMNRQRCVLRGVLAQSSPLELLTRYGSIANVLKDTLKTDIPQDRLVDFIDLIPRIDMERVGILHVDRDYISGTDANHTYYDQARIGQEAQALIADPTSGAAGGLSLESTCE